MAAVADSNEAKANPDVENLALGEESDEVVNEKTGNADDRKNMFRMGKLQELRRNFRFVSIFGFSMILQGTWEAVFGVATIGLFNGGTAGLIWMYLVCWIGFMFVNLSMAEMGSMAPTSGGQYHWVSEFAPRQHQQFLSYLMGWICVLGWQASCSGTAYVAGTQIQGLIVLGNPDYVYEKWHGTLLTIAVSAFSVLFNTTLAKRLPLIESLILGIHVFAFFGILATLWALSPRLDAKTVFTTFTDGGDWGSLGASALIGINSGVLPLLGADAAVHLSEEVRDAGKTLPMSMLLTTVFNGGFGWIMTITFAFCVTNVEQILASPTGYPFLQVFYNATQTSSGAIAMGVWVAIMTAFSSVTGLATASRQLFAFARDQAVPFSSFFSRVAPGWELPLNAIFFTFVFTSLISLINIGSPVALNDITSLMSSALLSSYICSIGCIIWRRVTHEKLLPSRFSLGKWGLFINIVSECFLVVGFVFSFFPTAPKPNATSFNWNVAIYGAVVVLSLGYFAVRGRHRYAGPVEYVRKLD